MLLKKITLLTSKLDELSYFYRDLLELNIINEASDAFTVQIGSTELTFKETELSLKPFYHFAINIPENKMSEAKSWIKSKVTLNAEEGEEEEVYFESWNAHSMYFEDPSGNLLEFIARHNLPNASQNLFSAKDLLQISEIGIVVDAVIPFVRKLNERGVPNWRDDSESLTPVGDENGLFIVVKSGRRWFFSEQHAKIYPVEVTIDGIGEFSFHTNRG